MDKLSVIGLGKLGLCSAACFAVKGFDVLGVDINNDLIKAVNSGKTPFYEPDLQELITCAKGKLKATQDYQEAIYASDITFLIVPTPTGQDGHFSDKYLKSALEPLAAALKNSKKDYHLFVITSTVSPGTVSENIVPLIEKCSGRKLNKSFGVCYNPEFVALGNVIKDFLNPDLVLIGESNEYAGNKLEEIYKNVCEAKPYIARMSIISAEIAKISLNSYITMKISFANTLANVCETIPGANIDDITKALGADRRVSPYYFRGGLSYGGPCFPRDNKAFVAFARKCGVEAKLAQICDEVNDSQIKHLVELILKNLHEDDNPVAVLGLAYKQNTAVIDKSPAIKLIEELLKIEREIIVYDPLAVDSVKAIFGDSLLYVSTVKECMLNSSTCIFASPLEEFKFINSSYINYDPTVIFDCWRILDPLKLGNKVKYVPLGVYINK